MSRRTPWRRLAAVALAALLLAGAGLSSASAEEGGSSRTERRTADWAGNKPNPTGGTDYFVDASGGDDHNSGTSDDQAWRTFTAVNERTFSPGDRILLKAGESWHDQQLWPKGSGAPGKPIMIDAYGPRGKDRPYIAANGTTPSPFVPDTQVKDPQTVGTTGAVVLRNQQYWEIANLEISNDDDFDHDITTDPVVRDGISITINADLFGADESDKIMDYFRIHDVYVHDVDGPSSWQQIHYGGIVFQVFGEKPYEEYETGAYYFKDVRIENNTFERTELHAIQFAFNWFYDRDPESGQFDENGKWHEGWEQLWVRDRDLYSRDIYIGHNYAADIGQGAIQLANSKNLIAEYNEINGYLQRYEAVSVALYLWAGADSVMQYNEVYGGPDDEYDGTPWDLEFTNFNVTYQYNYSHDNPAGWMSYMGNSSNSIARYNLSVDDNGVLIKNMLSSNYSPTYFLNNVFVYDGAELKQVHDETFLSPVYFLNNVFYNKSTTTPTTWYRKPDALRHAVFSNNAYFEASGEHSPQQPRDDAAVMGDPKFVGDPTKSPGTVGPTKLRRAAARFVPSSRSPLIDAGRYNTRVGDADFLGTPIYYGDAPDIGLIERRNGPLEKDPTDPDPIEDDRDDPRTDLALGVEATASSTHPVHDFEFHAGRLVDGDVATRWAAADDPDYPVTITLDFGEPTTFAEVVLDEYTDSNTVPRVQTYLLQRWDGDSESWETFAEGTDGIGHDLAVNGFGDVTTERLRLLITSPIEGGSTSPTMTRISVYAESPAG